MKKFVLATAVAQSLAGLAWADDKTSPLEETLVQGSRDSRTILLDETLELTPDSAALLRKAPGANVNSNGPLTGIAQVRGMYGARVSTEVNGQAISAGGPNWMDPPLSYAPAAQLESLEVYRGIVPVSAGQETIGGAVKATTWRGEFESSADMRTQGRLTLGGQSVNGSQQVSGAAAMANDTHKVYGALLSESGDHAAFPGGDITPTLYDRQRADLGYEVRAGQHRFHLDVARSKTGDTGTPALPMDIDYIDSDLASAMYHLDTGGVKFEAMVYASDIDHGMTNFHLRQPPMMETMWRQTIASGENRGARAKMDIGSWVLGADLHHELHNANIDNPNNPMFFVVNFHNASREVAGLFGEHNGDWGNGLETQVGVRVNRVTMNADQVDGTPAMMMPPAQVLRDTFNSADRHRQDTNVDAVAKVFRQQGNWNWYAGAAQKTRSPAYQERYLWLPMEATAGMADGRTYVGNIELKPEVAHELELGFDFSNGPLQLSPRVFIRKVKDFIQGTPVESGPAAMVAAMMAATQSPLQFNNVDAQFTGMDMDLHYALTSRASFTGVISYVEGEREDIHDNLYRIAPLNGSLALNWDASAWGATVETVLYAGQDKVSQTQTEKTTAGYGLLNVRGYWTMSSHWQLAAGLENALDKNYRNHLSGYNRVMAADVPVGERLPGYGRNIFLRLDFIW